MCVCERDQACKKYLIKVEKYSHIVHHLGNMFRFLYQNIYINNQPANEGLVPKPCN